MNDKITYHQQVSYCGKPRCKRCREGIGHGPYWYAYQTIDGRTTRTYIGKHLPADKEAAMQGNQSAAAAQAAEKDQSVIRIYTLGQFRLERRDPHDHLDWQTATDAAWKQQRVRALLGCLISVGGRKLGREQLMDALWPDLDIETAVGRLDRAVYSLRQVFEPGRNRPATSPLLLTEREVLSLADSSKIWVDADVFEQLIVKAHEIRGDEDLGTKEKLLKEAASLYGGEFLSEDRRNEWTRARRESLQRSWIGLLLELADLMINRDALLHAIEPLDKLISADPTNEAGVQRLMIVLEKLGRRGEALRAYKKLAHVLQQEYAILPLPDTRKLYEDLRRGSNKDGQPHDERIVDGKVREVTSAPMGVSESAAVQIGRTHQSPLVGRQQELTQLKDLIAATEQTARFRLGSQRRSTVATLDPNRRPQCVLLMGDVGIGKTRLAEELGREAKKKGWAVAWSRVYAQEGNIPYRLWTEVLRKAMDQGVWQRQEVKRRPLVFQPLGTLLPEIHDLLSTVNFPSSLSPEQEQLRLWEAARELLTLISESTPLLIALDDLQWADSSSCELLAYLARRTYGYPIVIVGTCRENELEQNSSLRPLLTDLRRENAVETISLDLLSADHITSLVSQVSHAPEPMIEKITDRAAGNPFFAEELARSVVENLPSLEALARSGNDILPDTISAVLALRMARLSEKCQLLLGKAAVLGGSFEFQVISEMESKGNTLENEDLVLELLEEALTSGMLTEEGTGTKITYHFWHPLLSTYLYDRSSAARRASQHRKAAEVFRKMYKNHEEEGAATITNHLVKGGADDELIAQYAELAGNNASLLSSYREAEDHYRIAFEHLGANHDDWQRVSYLLERIGECNRVRGEFEKARHFYENAFKLHFQTHNKPSIEIKQDAQVQAMLLWEIGVSWYSQGDLLKCMQYIERAAKTLHDVDVINGIVWAKIKFQQSYVLLRQGNYSETKIRANEALNFFSEIQTNSLDEDSSYLSIKKRALNGNLVEIGRIHTLLSHVEAALGQCEDALTHLNKALAIAEQNNYQREIAIINCDMGDLYLRTAEYTLTQSVLRKSYNIVEYIEDKPLESMILCNMGVLNIRIGNLADASDELIRALDLVKDPPSTCVYSAYLAFSLLEQGKVSEAQSVLVNAITVGRKTHVLPYVSFTLVMLGYLHLIQYKKYIIGDDNNNSKADKKSILKNAKKALLRALNSESLEMESRIEGRLIISQVLFQLKQYEDARLHSTLALKEAQQLRLSWLVARSQHVLGYLCAHSGLHEQAIRYYEQALPVFRKSGMKIEYARILKNYGSLLLEMVEANTGVNQGGLNYLQEAYQIFDACGAELDLQELSMEMEKLKLLVKRT
ncbi:hypothetical protein KDA_65820 [Dictyobacter alpinus]|uniref:Bacterial transcriptional activator domain-containing protein n=1 Tax=Dictyobacter alpinus TaxID=2014873 RepID=A0A402BI67_9CHLR|nr:DUF6788 family protein [Dictyobacter alpinus]GCE31098.1 hypothetical protein KDA_65820 [Dictyobacter alpinus]